MRWLGCAELDAQEFCKGLLFVKADEWRTRVGELSVPEVTRDYVKMEVKNFLASRGLVVLAQKDSVGRERPLCGTGSSSRCVQDWAGEFFRQLV
jgi:hypothetical protein